MRRESRRSPGPHQRAQRRSRSVPPRRRIQRGIVGRAPPGQRKGHKRAVLAQQGLAVFHAQDVIGRAQHRACCLPLSTVLCYTWGGGVRYGKVPPHDIRRPPAP